MTRGDAPEPTRRFDRRVEDYVKYRPGYPPELLECLRNETGLTPDHVVADIGSGTGILTRLFLENGNKVYGVEPNDSMRAAAESLLADFGSFCSVAARAEDTSLPDNAIDFVVAGQAFHWFDIERVRVEFARILRPEGWCALVWNARRTQSTPFLVAFETFLQKWGTDYADVSARYEDPTALSSLFRDGAYEKRTFENRQHFDFPGLRGRVGSSSYMPAAGAPQYDAMTSALARLFDEYKEDGRVVFEYDSNLYYGKL